ncbi:MAG: leucine-rich repeat domain-containing protein, partial [Clostridia bacterium]|nr:leucine-rich repeat domain-containing protein [Clostridia bacterium]
IENRAFFNREIESIDIPASVKSIGSMAFSGCKKLHTVTFENDSLTQLGDRIFSGCTALESITLPENVTVIGPSTFSGCTSLHEVIFNEKLEQINRSTFEGCTALENCEIPASVTYINPTAFRCAEISKLTVAEGNDTYFIDSNCIIERATNTVIAGADNAVIPAYVTAIGNYAFYKRNVESIVIPEGLQSIGYYAFDSCTLLRNVTFEGMSELQTIAGYAFNECTSLMGITLPVSVREIGSHAFYNCSAITSVTFCTLGPAVGGLIPVYATSDLESIGSYAFSGTSIKTFKIPAAVTKIESGAFRSDKLTSITVEEGNTAYKMESGCLIEIATGTLLFAIDNAVIPDGVKIINGSAFDNYKGKKLEIPAGVENVGYYAFIGWTAEQTIVIKGFSSRAEADAAWGTSWLSSSCKANIIYAG